MAVNLFYFLVFPGLLFAAVIGGFLSWFDRKITARVQFRKGPPLLQPFYDFFKLLTGEGNNTAKTRITFDISFCSGICSIWCNYGRCFHSASPIEYHNWF